ncbi:GNAT family N-acetyltransferase [Streptomyces sp. NPDC058221]|uniref:GNAT family N-acetyltransferase n=1 Tax=Streptomyces sp. NPDC058221 TaxID=3346388 RepID=UPI0036F0C892
MDMTIRPVEPAEHALLGEITAEAYLGDGLLDFGADDPYLVHLRDVARRAAEAEVLVAADARGRILGGVTYAPPGNRWADIAAPDEAEFRMLAVSREARGAGAGEALVRACIDRARGTAGVTGIVLSTQPAMRGAHRIYGRLGFVRTPERDWNPLDDLKLLTYRLALPATS